VYPERIQSKHFATINDSRKRATGKIFHAVVT
jgi:hypothetical protein